ncbi:MAG: DUF6379 domain-containing protein [Pseudolysinimonas sp.]
MLDISMIQTRGFKNAPDGRGFELRIRSPYYRGLWTDLIDGAAVTVDGERFDADSIGWTIDGRSYTLAELRDSSTERWPIDVAAVLTVPRDAPLTIGMHDVSVDVRLRMSYIPVELQPTISTEQRRLAITR